jgi:arylsulfatase A-like enzyme
VDGVLDFYAIRLAGMSEDFFGVYPVHRTFFKELALRLQRFGLARVQPIDRSRVAVPLIWEVAHAARRSVGVVDGYYYSYPAPVLGDPGSFFLGYGSDATVRQARDEKRPLTHAEAALQAWPPMLLTTEDRFLLRPDFEWQGSTLLDLLAHYGQPELVTMYSHEPDAVQHARWRFHEPSKFFGVDPATAAEHDDVASFYRQLDAYLGRLRARLSSDTVLVVVSDHGHSPTIFHSMDTQHRHGPPGILLLHGGPVRAGRLPPNAGVLDVYPTLLYLLGIPVPADADGKVLTAAFEPEFIKEHPAKVVSSFDGIPIPRSAAPPDEERRRLELEKLHSLGYIR